MTPPHTRRQASFRQAAAELDPEARSSRAPDAARIEAWLTLHSVRGKLRWLDAAIAAADSLAGQQSPPPGEAAEWLRVACLGWVLRATRSFRQLADSCLDRIEDSPAAVPALLRFWRITGLRRVHDRALACLPKTAAPGDFVGGVACQAGYLATAREELAEAARSAFSVPIQDVPARHWPTLAAVRGLGAQDFAEALQAGCLDQASAPERVLAAAALALPPLELEVQWWVENELREGPMAEAATYPYPALRMHFTRLQERDQLRFVPRLGGETLETVYDVGVVGAALEIILEDVDRSGLLDGASRRRGRGLLRP